MLTNKQKKQFLMIALTCLRKKGEKRPIFSPDIPTDKELSLIQKSLDTGDIEEKLLKKLFPMAYDGVVEHGIFKYFFFVHNKKIKTLDRYVKTNLVDWCTAYPAKIIDKKGSKWIVKRVDGKTLESDTDLYPGLKVNIELKKGSLIMLHRGKIHMVLTEKEYEEAVRLFKSN